MNLHKERVVAALGGGRPEGAVLVVVQTLLHRRRLQLRNRLRRATAAIAAATYLRLSGTGLLKRSLGTWTGSVASSSRGCADTRPVATTPSSGDANRGSYPAGPGDPGFAPDTASAECKRNSRHQPPIAPADSCRNIPPRTPSHNLRSHRKTPGIPIRSFGTPDPDPRNLPQPTDIH